MKKKDLVDLVSTETGYTKASVQHVIDSVFENIKSAVSKGEKAGFVGFGSFVVKKRSARKGINPNTGEKIKIKASKRAGFLPSSLWKVK